MQPQIQAILYQYVKLISYDLCIIVSNSFDITIVLHVKRFRPYLDGKNYEKVLKNDVEEMKSQRHYLFPRMSLKFITQPESIIFAWFKNIPICPFNNRSARKRANKENKIAYSSIDATERRKPKTFLSANIYLNTFPFHPQKSQLYMP